MKVAVTVGRLASLARAEAGRHPARTPQRRAAAHLWTSLITTSSVTAARNAIGTFGEPVAQADALELLHRLASQEGATT